MSVDSRAHLDHVVVATPDLEATVADFEAATGVRPEFGGAHPGAGSRNHLVTFGDGSYLEIIGVDPDQGEPERPRRFLIDERTQPVVATWAAHPGDIDQRITQAREAGLDLGPVSDGGRRTPSGESISWRVTEPLITGRDGVIPFLIDWGTTPSPATTIEPRAELTEFVLTDPEPDVVQEQLRLLGLDHPVVRGDRAGVAITVTGPQGSWSLSGWRTRVSC